MHINPNLGGHNRKKYLPRSNSRTVSDLLANHEINHQLRGIAMNCKVIDGLCTRVITNKIVASL